MWIKIYGVKTEAAKVSSEFGCRFRCCCCYSLNLHMACPMAAFVRWDSDSDRGTKKSHFNRARPRDIFGMQTKRHTVSLQLHTACAQVLVLGHVELPSLNCRVRTHTHTKFAYFNCLLFSHRLLLLIRYCASGKQRLFVVERVSGRDGVTEMTARRREIYWFDARPTGIRSLLIRAWSHHASVYGCSSSSCNK